MIPDRYIPIFFQIYENQIFPHKSRPLATPSNLSHHIYTLPGPSISSRTPPHIVSIVPIPPRSSKNSLTRFSTTAEQSSCSYVLAYGKLHALRVNYEIPQLTGTALFLDACKRERESALIVACLPSRELAEFMTAGDVRAKARGTNRRERARVVGFLRNWERVWRGW